MVAFPDSEGYKKAMEAMATAHSFRFRFHLHSFIQLLVAFQADI